MNQVKKIHAHTLRNGLDFTQFLMTKLLEIPNIPYAHKLFDNTPNPAVFLYNKLIQAYSSDGPHSQCFSLYIQMCRQGCFPNAHTFTFLFVSCSSLSNLRLGQVLHSDLIKHGFLLDIFALTALVDMYAKTGSIASARRQFEEMKIRDLPTWNSLISGYVKNGNMDEALHLFSTMPSRNVISWTTMISGFTQNGQYGDALAIFREMEKETEVRANQVTIASILPACANLGALEFGKRIEAYARENGFFQNMFVRNAVLELYVKCGRLDTAMEVFVAMGKRRNLCSWNTMIMGLAIHGKGTEAIGLFNKMLGERISPDDVTFVGAIMACTHGGGMVARGWELFMSMEKKYSIAPKLEHYGCMVDLLGRAGNLEEAYDLIRNMPMRPDSVVWGTLLGGCSFHCNVELAEKAAHILSELEPWNPGNYVILSNIYARAGRWDGVMRLRKEMKGSQIRKGAGYSFIIEGGGQMHKFIVEDKSHPRTNEIYALLNDIVDKCKLCVNGIYIDSDFAG
ncbi:unnamed protein product [Cuscuta epithymum]|uniref:Pentatricopeptide repeat-containing protein n=1 Tax=Cuscuta epithymum TaxID=186058 RepID=A0AAV0G046_9ASTE|nr:unnamed protein product [Cuscuta epithymum]